MSDYTKLTDFAAKDVLSAGDPDKLVLGSELDAEFEAIQAAIATKTDGNGSVVDGDKGDVVVSGSGLVWTIPGLVTKLTEDTANTAVTNSVTQTVLAQYNMTAGELAVTGDELNVESLIEVTNTSGGSATCTIEVTLTDTTIGESSFAQYIATVPNNESHNLAVKLMVCRTGADTAVVLVDMDQVAQISGSAPYAPAAVTRAACVPYSGQTATWAEGVAVKIKATLSAASASLTATHRYTKYSKVKGS